MLHLQKNSPLHFEGLSAPLAVLQLLRFERDGPFADEDQYLMESRGPEGKDKLDGQGQGQVAIVFLKAASQLHVLLPHSQKKKNSAYHFLTPEEKFIVQWFHNEFLCNLFANLTFSLKNISF